MQVQITSKYRVVIPKEIRERLKIYPGQKMSFEVVSRKIFMTPVKADKV